MSGLYEQLVTRLEEGMARRKITQLGLAARTGVSQGNISKILRRQRSCKLETWDKLLSVVEE